MVIVRGLRVVGQVIGGLLRFVGKLLEFVVLVVVVLVGGLLVIAGR